MVYVWEDLCDGWLIEVMEKYLVVCIGNIYVVYLLVKYVLLKIIVLVDFLIFKYGCFFYWEMDYCKVELVVDVVVWVKSV